MFAADLREIEITCPHCGALHATMADPSVQDQQYVEDCHVCCAPILLHLYVDWASEMILVEAQRENY